MQNKGNELLVHKSLFLEGKKKKGVQIVLIVLQWLIEVALGMGWGRGFSGATS